MNVEFSSARLSDSEFVFHLRNAPEVRHFARNTEIIPREAHEVWFRQRILDSENHPFWVVRYRNVPIGYVRFDRDSRERFFISIAISESFRGRGLGTIVLSESISKIQGFFPSEKIAAVVHSENLVSIRIFRSAGFTIVIQEPNFVTLEL